MGALFFLIDGFKENFSGFHVRCVSGLGTDQNGIPAQCTEAAGTKGSVENCSLPKHSVALSFALLFCLVTIIHSQSIKLV